MWGRKMKVVTSTSFCMWLLIELRFLSCFCDLVFQIKALSDSASALVLEGRQGGWWSYRWASAEDRQEGSFPGGIGWAPSQESLPGRVLSLSLWGHCGSQRRRGEQSLGQTPARGGQLSCPREQLSEGPAPTAPPTRPGGPAHTLALGEKLACGWVRTRSAQSPDSRRADSGTSRADVCRFSRELGLGAGSPGGPLGVHSFLCDENGVSARSGLCPEGSWTHALTHHGHLMDCQMRWHAGPVCPPVSPLPCGCPLPHSLPIPQVRCVEQGGSRWGVQPSQLLV